LGVTMWNEIMLFAPNPSAVETLRAWLRYATDRTSNTVVFTLKLVPVR